MEIPILEEELADRIRRLETRLERERRARIEAENLLEAKSLELYEANLSLSELAASLECRVQERTLELNDARRAAERQAETDALTAIPNRAAFTHRLDGDLASGRTVLPGPTLLLIDLDDFKTVNDTIGHGAGDALLTEVARRLSNAIGPAGFVARLGGDEFAVLLHEAVGHAQAQRVAHDLLDQVSQPLAFHGFSLQCSCSIGIAEATPAVLTADALMCDADLALYAAKRAGRSRVVTFEPALRTERQQQAALEHDLRRAIAESEIAPWYQPIVSYGKRRVVGMEVLSRWHLHSGEVRLPSAFLGGIESLGLLDDMMEGVLLRAFAEALPLVKAGALDYLAINISPAQFNRGWAQHALPRLLADIGYPPYAVVLEVTETALIDDPARVRAMLAGLTASGMRIALDDFGTGYSNFSLLRQLPFNFLKLDRSLTADIETDEPSRAMTQCILDLADHLKITVVAEGVETRSQADFLLAAGCEMQQGFLHARPQRDPGIALTQIAMRE